VLSIGIAGCDAGRAERRGPQGDAAAPAAAFGRPSTDAPACLIELDRAAGGGAVADETGAGSRPAHTGRAGTGLEAGAGNELAAFGMGCFWGAEVLYGARLGVERTSVGYAGGRHTGPTYHDIGDHIETVLVEYDPTVVSYEALLDIFWAGHNPGRNPWMNQYRSMIFPVTEAQEAIARRAVARERDTRMGAVLTEIRPIDRFYPDLTYHDKYYLRSHEELWAAVTDAFGSTEAARASTAAARLNALSAGQSSRAAVAAALSAAADAGEISPRAEAALLEMVPTGR
jgi:peptide-methionine (S)-S-oxide reductase